AALWWCVDRAAVPHPRTSSGDSPCETDWQAARRRRRPSTSWTLSEVHATTPERSSAHRCPTRCVVQLVRRAPARSHTLTHALELAGLRLELKPEGRAIRTRVRGNHVPHSAPCGVKPRCRAYVVARQ